MSQSEHRARGKTYVVIGENGSKVVARRLGSAGQGERVGDLESGGEGETLGKIGSGSIEEEVGEVGFCDDREKETQDKTRSG